MQGLKSLNRKLTRTIPEAVRAEVRKVMEAKAEEVAAMMRRLAPRWLAPSIEWGWGPPPSGAVRLWQGGKGDLLISIYSTDFRARWFEFGTGERVQKSTGRRTGRITAQPYFYPSWRANKRRAKSAIARAMRKGIKQGAR